MSADELLKRMILDELDCDPKVNPTDIGVTVSNGAVTLLGHVSSFATKFSATDAVKRVRGVKAISDEIEVNLPTERRRDDSDIAAHIARLLDWNESVSSNVVKAIVSNGNVTLSGEVEFQHQREHIEEQVRHVEAVTGIKNRIALRLKEPADNVKKRIEDALHRSAALASENVTVSFEGNTARLGGTVKAFYERDLAERAAWNVPGVNDVQNKIIIV